MSELIKAVHRFIMNGCVYTPNLPEQSDDTDWKPPRWEEVEMIDPMLIDEIQLAKWREAGEEYRRPIPPDFRMTSAINQAATGGHLELVKRLHQISRRSIK
jgi:hypothetical protein